MNWFQRLWSNPNTHIIVGTIAGVASSFVPLPYQAVAAALAGAFGAAGVALPSSPPTMVVPATAPIQVPTGTVANPGSAPVINLHPALAGGSFHTVDYANLAAELINQFGRAAPVVAAEQVKTVTTTSTGAPTA